MPTDCHSSTLNSQLSTSFAQGTAFTYQGQLGNNGQPANGTYNLTFSLFYTNTGGNRIAGPLTNSAVGIPPLDFLVWLHDSSTSRLLNCSTVCFHRHSRFVPSKSTSTPFGLAQTPMCGVCDVPKGQVKANGTT